MYLKLNIRKLPDDQGLVYTSQKKKRHTFFEIIVKLKFLYFLQKIKMKQKSIIGTLQCMIIVI